MSFSTITESHKNMTFYLIITHLNSNSLINIKMKIAIANIYADFKHFTVSHTLSLLKYI